MTDPTAIEIDVNPTVQRMKGVTLHGSAAFDVPLIKLVESNVPNTRMAQVDQWQVDPHRKRGNALRSGSDAAASLCRCIRCNDAAVDATKSDATSCHPMQPPMVTSWSGA